MDIVGILVCYNGSLVHKDNIQSYECEDAKGCNGIVSIESSNAPPPFFMDIPMSVENIVADLCAPSNEEESYSAPNMHPHGDNNFKPSTVQVRQVQYEPPQ
ncbi:unnamed protein product [Prunus armeniaca]